MSNRFSSLLAAIARPLVENRLVLSFGLSVAAGISFESLWPINPASPLLHLIVLERPAASLLLIWSYRLFLYSTPFLAVSVLLSFIYVHFYARDPKQALGSLPEYPDPRFRRDLFLVLGEVHQQLRPDSSPDPHWLAMPELGLYTGINVIGAIGSAKTQAVILPAMRQLFAYHADDPDTRLSGMVLEVKGDLCRQLRRILAWCGREQDYVEVSLDGEIRYNPLNNDLDPYAQAYNIAAIITSIWGKGKEPFWQQSYTDLVRYVIILHRVRDGYVTLVDVFRTVISAGKLEDMLTECGRKFTPSAFVGLAKTDYLKYESLLRPFGFVQNDKMGQMIARWREELGAVLSYRTNVAASLYKRKLQDQKTGDRWTSVHYWYWEHWKFFRSEVKTSIIQGIEIFLSLFETDPQVRRVFCPPKELYEGKSCPLDPDGRVLPSFDELIESGTVVALNFPVALNPVLAKTIGTGGFPRVGILACILLRLPSAANHRLVKGFFGPAGTHEIDDTFGTSTFTASLRAPILNFCGISISNFWPGRFRCVATNQPFC